MKQNEDALEMEIIRKIREMEDPAYIFPPRFSKNDYITVGICILACLAMLIGGAYL